MVKHYKLLKHENIATPLQARMPRFWRISL